MPGIRLSHLASSPKFAEVHTDSSRSLNVTYKHLNTTEHSAGVKDTTMPGKQGEFNVIRKSSQG